jgi:hypothetical protein
MSQESRVKRWRANKREQELNLSRKLSQHRLSKAYCPW